MTKMIKVNSNLILVLAVIKSHNAAAIYKAESNLLKTFTSYYLMDVVIV